MMFGKPDPRDSEILFLREQVKTLQQQVLALTDIRAAALMAQGQRAPHVPGPPAPVRLSGPQAIRESGMRVGEDGRAVPDTDQRINRSFEIS